MDLRNRHKLVYIHIDSAVTAVPRSHFGGEEIEDGS